MSIELGPIGSINDPDESVSLSNGSGNSVVQNEESDFCDIAEKTNKAANVVKNHNAARNMTVSINEKPTVVTKNILSRFFSAVGSYIDGLFHFWGLQKDPLVEDLTNNLGHLKEHIKYPAALIDRVENSSNSPIPSTQKTGKELMYRIDCSFVFHCRKIYKAFAEHPTVTLSDDLQQILKKFGENTNYEKAFEANFKNPNFHAKGVVHTVIINEFIKVQEAIKNANLAQTGIPEIDHAGKFYDPKSVTPFIRSIQTLTDIDPTGKLIKR